jgi:predicted enzyme related to lactoylglutathione lyase
MPMLMRSASARAPLTSQACFCAPAVARTWHGKYWPPDAPNYAHFMTHSGATFAVMEAEGRGGRFNFTVDDPDALWNQVKGLAIVVEPLFDTPYGTRKFTIADPDGNELGFVRNG